MVRGFRFVTEVSTLYSIQFFATLGPAKLLAVTAAVHAKVLGSPTTIRHQLRASALRAPVFSGAFRRLARPAGKLARRLEAAATPLRYEALVEAVPAAGSCQHRSPRMTTEEGTGEGAPPGAVGAPLPS